MRKKDSVNRKRIKLLIIVASILILLIVSVNVVLKHPATARYINLQVALGNMQKEIAKKSIKKNYVEVILNENEYKGKIDSIDVHVNNYKDQMRIKDILSHCTNLYGEIYYATSPYDKVIYIGEYKVNIMVSHPGIGCYRYHLSNEYLNQLYDILSTIPDYDKYW